MQTKLIDLCDQHSNSSRQTRTTTMANQCTTQLAPHCQSISRFLTKKDHKPDGRRPSQQCSSQHHHHHQPTLVLIHFNSSHQQHSPGKYRPPKSIGETTICHPAVPIKSARNDQWWTVHGRPVWPLLLLLLYHYSLLFMIEIKKKICNLLQSASSANSVSTIQLCPVRLSRCRYLACCDSKLGRVASFRFALGQQLQRQLAMLVLSVWLFQVCSWLGLLLLSPFHISAVHPTIVTRPGGTHSLVDKYQRYGHPLLSGVDAAKYNLPAISSIHGSAPAAIAALNKHLKRSKSQPIISSQWPC